MARHYSPPGTFESIRKSLLEDPTFTDAEFRLLCYLATKPKDWVIHRKQIARDLERSERHWVVPALKGLRARGLIVMTDERDERGRVRKRESQLRRNLVIVQVEHNSDGKRHCCRRQQRCGVPAGQHNSDA